MCYKNIVAITFALLLLSGCAIAWFELREVEGVQVSNNDWVCPSSYAISIKSRYDSMRVGEGRSTTEDITELQSKLDKVVSRTLKELGCNNVESSPKEEVNKLVINVSKGRGVPLLQLYLTIFSLGYIPTWGTIENYVLFEISQREEKRTYAVDSTSLYHITMQPFFWVSYFLEDIESELKDALHRFSKHS